MRYDGMQLCVKHDIKVGQVKKNSDKTNIYDITCI